MSGMGEWLEITILTALVTLIFNVALAGYLPGWAERLIRAFLWITTLPYQQHRDEYESKCYHLRARREALEHRYGSTEAASKLLHEEFFRSIPDSVISFGGALYGLLLRDARESALASADGEVAYVVPPEEYLTWADLISMWFGGKLRDPLNFLLPGPIIGVLTWFACWLIALKVGVFPGYVSSYRTWAYASGLALALMAFRFGSLRMPAALSDMQPIFVLDDARDERFVELVKDHLSKATNDRQNLRSGMRFLLVSLVAIWLVVPLPWMVRMLGAESVLFGKDPAYFAQGNVVGKLLVLSLMVGVVAVPWAMGIRETLLNIRFLLTLADLPVVSDRRMVVHSLKRAAVFYAVETTIACAGLGALQLAFVSTMNLTALLFMGMWAWMAFSNVVMPAYAFGRILVRAGGTGRHP